MFPEILQTEIRQILAEKISAAVHIHSIEALAGGDINFVYKINTNLDAYVVKWNYTNKFPLMFEAEASGLQLLKSAAAIEIPEVIAFSEIENYSFLILKFITSGKRRPDFWEDFGLKLAGLHKNTESYFGLDSDNYIGSLHQSNTKKENWAAFFIEQRLQPVIKLAKDHHLIDNSLVIAFEKLFSKMDSLFPQEIPALLHGDLWNGNYMVSPDGSACLIDPAVYYGHREMDIAMTKLFGGFDSNFYDAYNKVFPMENGWQQRMDYCNLYPLMVHVNLFGIGYVNAVKTILQKF
ncbi:MAG: fructosamine kinase family protein [Bacteroidetes bacterium]|nr:fructosamine kinase family protein [Bacteroidota bacterium]